MAHFSTVLLAVLVALASPLASNAAFFNCTALFEDVDGSPCDQTAACTVGSEGTAECRELVSSYCAAAGRDKDANEGCSNLGDVGPTASPTRQPTNAPTHFPTAQPTVPTEAPTPGPTAQPTKRKQHPDRLGLLSGGAGLAAGARGAAHVVWAAAVGALLAARAAG